MKFLIGRKQNMAQIFDEKGRVTGVTIVKQEPLKVTQIKTLEKDGYVATQVGFGVQKESRVNKPQRTKGLFKGFKEIKEVSELENFQVGDTVEVSGTSKGKGFQGVVKRHGFHGGRRSHGQKHSEREPGSIGGAGRAGGRVAKGMRMAGRMGGDRITVKNLKVIAIEGDDLYLSGAVPGRRGTLLEIRGTKHETRN
ncbi:MAG: 50S ribosomal protein L3 [Patescibacteria group bacterium]